MYYYYCGYLFARTAIHRLYNYIITVDKDSDSLSNIATVVFSGIFQSWVRNNIDDADRKHTDRNKSIWLIYICGQNSIGGSYDI